MAKNFYKKGKAFDDEAWDDAVLIEAYDRTMELVKKKVGGRSGGEKSKLPSKKQSGKAKQWKVGDHCRAVYSLDQRLYEAEIVLVNEEKGTCIVEFIGYGNEEQVDLSSVCPSQGKRARTHQALSVQEKDDAAMKWSIGDRCMAVYYGDERYYEAEILDIHYKDGYITVRYVDYDEEDNVDTNYILPLESQELQFPSQTNGATNGSSFDETSSNMSSASSTRNSLEDSHLLHMNFPAPPHGAEFLPNILMRDSAMEELGPMLMSWYMAGFHTGYYQGRCSKLTSSGAEHPHT